MRMRQSRIIIPLSQIQLLLKIAQSSYPRETSGLMLGYDFRQYTLLNFVATSNSENTPFTFRIKDAEIAEVADSAKETNRRICGCFHSHILGVAKPSAYDIACPKNEGDLWLIYAVKYSDIRIFRWDGESFQKQRFTILRENQALTLKNSNMSQSKDKYDLAQPSLSGKPGLETFRRKKDGSYVFHVNDKKGAAFLFSQGYETAEGRDKGWQAVLKNAPERKRYEIKTGQNQFYFVLKAGNNQEIARSRFFDTKLALDTAMEYLAGLFLAPELAAELEAKPLKPPFDEAELALAKSQVETERLENKRLNETIRNLNAQIQQLKKSQNNKPQAESAASANPQTGKHAFRLELYREENEPLRGRIEHLLTQQKQVFQGLDWNGIMRFVGSYLPESDAGELRESTSLNTAEPGEKQEHEENSQTGTELPVLKQETEQKLVIPMQLLVLPIPEEEAKIATFSKDGNQTNGFFRAGEAIFFNLPFSSFTPDFQLEVLVQLLTPGASGQPDRRVRANKTGQQVFMNGLSQPGLYRLHLDTLTAGSDNRHRAGKAMVRVY